MRQNPMNQIGTPLAFILPEKVMILVLIIIFAGIVIIILELFRNQNVEKADKMHCPFCEKDLEDNFIYCPHCGNQLKKICVQCKNELQPFWKVCPYCGNVSKPENSKWTTKNAFYLSSWFCFRFPRLRYCSFCIIPECWVLKTADIAYVKGIITTGCATV